MDVPSLFVAVMGLYFTRGTVSQMGAVGLYLRTISQSFSTYYKGK